MTTLSHPNSKKKKGEKKKKKKYNDFSFLTFVGHFQLTLRQRAVLLLAPVDPFVAPASKVPGLKSAHTYTPANSMESDGPVANLLSVLCMRRGPKGFNNKIK